VNFFEIKVENEQKRILINPFVRITPIRFVTSPASHKSTKKILNSE